MPKNYQQSKIYRLVSDEDDKIYVGSTQLKYLSTRLALFKQRLKEYEKNPDTSRYNYTTAYEILKYPSVRIELIENFPYNSINELNTREGYHIKSNNCRKHIAVNKNIAGVAEREKNLGRTRERRCIIITPRYK